MLELSESEENSTIPLASSSTIQYIVYVSNVSLSHTVYITSTFQSNIEWKNEEIQSSS